MQYYFYNTWNILVEYSTIFIYPEWKVMQNFNSAKNGQFLSFMIHKDLWCEHVGQLEAQEKHIITQEWHIKLVGGCYITP